MRRSKMIMAVIGGIAIAMLADPVFAENVQQLTKIGNVEIWKIDGPTVNQRQTTYDQIQLRAGDTANVTAGGCVQTGGSGKTWKRYVDPQGPNSDHIYHGLIQLPGMPGLSRIAEFMANTNGFTIPAGASATLILGYEDDDYGDNGYWGHDDGTGDQCKDVENAWVQLVIVHPTH